MVKLDEATLTSQGQISIPKKVREKLHLQKGSKVVFLEDKAGHILIQEAEGSIEFTHEQWEAFLQKTQKEPVTQVKGKREVLPKNLPGLTWNVSGKAVMQSLDSLIVTAHANIPRACVFTNADPS